MTEYIHTTSPELSMQEKNLIALGLTEYDLDPLHRKYEESKYRFFTADEFTKAIQHDWYHFDKLFEKECGPDDYTHPYKPGLLEPVMAWYRLMRTVNPAIVEPGTPATVFYYSDSRAVTITKVEYYKDERTDEGGNLLPRKLGVVFNEVECKDYYAGDYDVKPLATDKQRCVEESYTFRKGGHWVREGETINDGLRLGVGYHHHYIDPNF